MVKTTLVKADEEENKREIKKVHRALLTPKNEVEVGVEETIKLDKTAKIIRKVASKNSVINVVKMAEVARMAVGRKSRNKNILKKRSSKLNVSTAKQTR